MRPRCNCECEFMRMLIKLTPRHSHCCLAIFKCVSVSLQRRQQLLMILLNVTENNDSAVLCAAPQITNAHKMPFGFRILYFGFRLSPFNTSQPTFRCVEWMIRHVPSGRPAWGRVTFRWGRGAWHGGKRSCGGEQQAADSSRASWALFWHLARAQAQKERVMI